MVVRKRKGGAGFKRWFKEEGKTYGRANRVGVAKVKTGHP